MDGISYLRGLREAKEGIPTQIQIAKACAMTKANYSRIENGLQMARPRTIRKLAEFFGVEPQEMRDKLKAGLV